MSLTSVVFGEADKATLEDLKKQCNELIPSVKDLTDRIQLLTFALQQYFIDTFLNFCITKSLEQLNYKNRKEKIVNEYNVMINDIEVLQSKYEVTDKELTKHSNKLKKSFHELKDLSVAVEGRKILDNANHAFRRYKYDIAILSIKKLLNQLKQLNFDDKLAKGLLNLRAQAENQLSIYAAHLSTKWEDIFQWDVKKSVYYVTYSLSIQQSDPILIQNVLKTLYETQKLNCELGQFSHFFISELLDNVIKHNCDIFTEDKMGALVFNIKIDTNDNKKPSYQTIFNNLMAIFEFLENTLGVQFQCDMKFTEVFASLIREKFFNKIINDCIKKNLPSCESSYEAYKSIVVELDCFNKFLIDIKFVESNKSPLNKYIDDTECVLYKKKCDKLLSDVRALLFESLTFGTLTVGDDTSTSENDSIMNDDKENNWDVNKPLFLPKCVISRNIFKVMSIIIEHLEESAKLPDKYRKQLVLYIKDAVVMYQGIVPKKFQTNLECCPMDIAIFFNNCFYLAHGLLGPPWKNTLPVDLASLLSTVLLESIQDLRVLALEKMSLYLQKQKEVILKSVEHRDNKEPIAWDEENFYIFDSAVNDAIILMNNLKASWINVLPDRMYEMSMCTLVQTLCQSILVRVFADTQPIDEALMYMLAVRLENTIQDVETLFEDSITLETKINIWPKFTRLPQILKAQLLELSELWNTSKDLSQSFSCEEIRQVVRMRFPDDKYRLKILMEIQ